MTSVPKPFKFLKTHYQLLVDHFNSKEDSQEKVHLLLSRRNTQTFCLFCLWFSERKVQERVFIICSRVPIVTSLNGDMNMWAIWLVISDSSTKSECKTTNLMMSCWFWLIRLFLILSSTMLSMMLSICFWLWTSLTTLKGMLLTKTFLKFTCIYQQCVGTHRIKINSLQF